jgi:hypothetical protein
MIARIVVLGALALTFTVTGFAALWWASALSLEINGVGFTAEDDQEAWELRFAWLNMLNIAGGPLVGAGLVAAVGALALVVLRRQVAGTRTVSAPASTSVRNPMTSPKSSPSSSNSSARSRRTSNVDAFR